MAGFELTDELAGAPTEKDVKEKPYAVWRENWKTLQIFLAMSTQWSVVSAEDGEMVRTCLKFDNFERVMKYRAKMPRTDWSQVFCDLQVMEIAALNAMTTERNKRRKRRAEEYERTRANSHRD